MKTEWVRVTEIESEHEGKIRKQIRYMPLNNIYSIVNIEPFNYMPSAKAELMPYNACSFYILETAEEIISQELK